MNENTNKKFDLVVEIRRFIRASLKAWMVYAIAIVAVVLITLAYAFVRKPGTEVNASLMLPPETSQNSGMLALSDIASSFSMGDMFGASNIDNEIAVMQSHTVYDRTVRQLGLNINYLEKERMLRTIPAYDRAQLHLSVDPAVADTFRYSLMFIIWPDSKGRNFEIEIRNTALDTRIAKLKDVTLPADIKTPFADFRLEKTAFFNEEEVYPKFLITYDSYNVSAQNLGGFVSIFAPNKKTDIISMSTIISDPNFGKKLLSTIIDNYNWLRNDQLAQTQRDNLEFVENRLVTLETELNDAQSAVQQFKEKNKITEPGTAASMLIHKAATLDGQIASTTTYNEILRMTRDFIANPANDRKMIPSMSVTTLSSTDTPSSVGAIEQYNILVLKLNEELSRVNTSNSTIETLEKQLSMLRANICESITRTLENSNVRLASMNRQNNETLSKMGTIPELEREYIDLERDVMLKQQLYLFLLKQREDARMGLTKKMDALITLDEPFIVAKTPGLKPKMLAMVLFFFSMVGAAAWIFFRKMPRTPLGSSEAVADASTVPVLAEIANAPLAGINMLRTDLRAILDPLGAKNIMVTTLGQASMPLASELASAFARAGHSTVLVDASFSGQNSVSGTSVAEICAGASCDATKEAAPNLHMIPSGSTERAVADIIASPAFAALVKRLGQRFDYVVIASPAIAEGSGAYALAADVDITLTAVDAHSATPTDLEFLGSLRRQGRFPRLSIVIA
ncbi:MAG: hypothetical protein NC241_02385 [Bacteroides sp.]|nr:hypothetical protein [Bacteroides sp.]MCM1457419.1 hypothetical protein [Lachnoclostridium sp.]